MQHPLSLYNTLTRRKDAFQPLHAPFVGVYLCGPTVYSEAHIGNARGPVVFDVLTRYLRYLGYTVRYVRNITDVGHLESDADEGEDKISRMARARQLEPMQVAEQFANLYHRHMEVLGCLPPDIEPRASGHITEQIQLIQEIIDNGFGYEAGGSVYFDVPAYNAAGRGYGKLSNRVVEELLAGSRDNLAGQEEKRSPLDFALWKKADARHLMRWPSPWGEGFPGWHLECSAMSRKYLGAEFDIHGGGLDLMFPHHECEIAQSQASHSHSDEARVWMHNNMITVNGQKMSKSLGNFVTISDLFRGGSSILTQPYSPMTARFFLLQAHYRSTVDVSDEAMQAARKGYRKLMNGLRVLDKLVLPEGTERTADTAAADAELRKLTQDCFAGLNDDLNTARCVASLFNLLRKFNGYAANLATLAQLSEAALTEATTTYRALVEEVLGLQDEPRANVEDLLTLTLGFYQEAKTAKDYGKVDAIRAALKEQGIVVKDTKAGVDWAYSEE
ncbi:cysteine--tRNA ligase [Hymenobacter lutimineralis]|uniref:Cysteine--tRNA ligase n=1 Tax=Hymenobacter lutimineralis TaxID=2606448 RepID=A0A5D6VDG0_9BACT|nr:MULTISPECIES: cysteine--tRNA ligase [Hymenobacter]QIX61193.1 cysteine--tRNA ligase [Hymenobacter sp. BT18]TYZ13410.1 cysteine--tRNA ligase [Hymenobacter lutimineralis]